MTNKNESTIQPGYEIKCLDHGFVRLVDWMGSDRDIVEAARVSYKSPTKGDDQDKRLLQYLWKNKHTSPFEMVKIKFNIKMPVFCMRQYIRHRMQNVNEVSARYTQLPNEFYIPDSWRPQDTKNKQGSIETDNWNPEVLTVEDELVVSRDATEALTKICNDAYETYEAMLEAGIAREMARMVLPVNIYTEIYCCWDLKNLIHFIGLRDDSHAQAEIQMYGRAIKQIAKELFPWTIEAYEKYKFKLEEQ